MGPETTRGISESTLAIGTRRDYVTCAPVKPIGQFTSDIIL